MNYSKSNLGRFISRDCMKTLIDSSTVALLAYASAAMGFRGELEGKPPPSQHTEPRFKAMMQAVSSTPRANRQAWGGVFALSLGAFALVASEFMPVSLLTPIATDLHISEGQAGQAISVSGAFALE